MDRGLEGEDVNILRPASPAPSCHSPKRRTQSLRAWRRILCGHVWILRMVSHIFHCSTMQYSSRGATAWLQEEGETRVARRLPANGRCLSSQLTVEPSPNPVFEPQRLADIFVACCACCAPSASHAKVACRAFPFPTHGRPALSWVFLHGRVRSPKRPKRRAGTARLCERVAAAFPGPMPEAGPTLSCVQGSVQCPWPCRGERPVLTIACPWAENAEKGGRAWLFQKA